MAIFTQALGDEPLHGTDESDSFYENAGNGTIYGGGSDDDFITNNVRGIKLFYGEAGNDFSSGEFNDLQATAFQGKKSDFIVTLVKTNNSGIPYYTDITDKKGAEGTDRIFYGIDELRFADKSLYWVGDRWSPTERMTEGNDKISLKDNDDQLAGRGGNDSIRGNGGNDELYGGDGNDTLKGGADNDNLNGGDGNDSLYGGDGNDIINEVSGNNRLNGEYGNDIISSAFSSDTVHGGEGNDTIGFDFSKVSYGFGDNGNDYLATAYSVETITLSGGEGNDTIVAVKHDQNEPVEAYTGNAYFLGGSGSDKFEFVNDAKGNVLIRDFTAGVDTVSFVESDIYHAFEDVLSHASANSKGYVVLNNGAEDAQIITLQGVTLADLSASDFSFS